MHYLFHVKFKAKMIKLGLLVLVECMCVFDKLFYFSWIFTVFLNKWLMLVPGHHSQRFWSYGFGMETRNLHFLLEDDGADGTTPNLGECWPTPGKPRCKPEVGVRNLNSGQAGFANRILRPKEQTPWAGIAGCLCPGHVW